MRGADQIRNRPMVVDAPAGKGRILMFANNPIYRWQTFGEHGMVFNALLFHNDFPPRRCQAARRRSSSFVALVARVASCQFKVTRPSDLRRPFESSV